MDRGWVALIFCPHVDGSVMKGNTLFPCLFWGELKLGNEN